MKKEFSTNRLEQLKKQARKMLKPGSTEDEIEACARSLDQSTMIEGSLAQSEMEDEHPSSVLPVKEVKNILAQMLKPAFATKRLQVFQMPMAVSDACGPGRMVFVAFRTDVRRRAQLVAATAVIGFLSYQSELKGLTPSCEWLEVIPEYRGEGLGPELYVGIEQHTGGTINGRGCQGRTDPCDPRSTAPIAARVTGNAIEEAATT